MSTRVKPILRWSVAGLVTIAVFVVTTWLCGALALPHVLKDPAARWGIAGALGVALAALAALWGHSFAEGRQRATTTSSSPQSAVSMRTGSGDVHNEIGGGTFHRRVTQSRDIFEGSPNDSAQASPPPRDQ
jgi:hypothetical protein